MRGTPRVARLAERLEKAGLQDRGDVERARELWSKARELYARIGMPHMVKHVQGSLDRLPKPAAKSRRASGGCAKGERTGKKT